MDKVRMDVIGRLILNRANRTVDDVVSPLWDEMSGKAAPHGEVQSRHPQFRLLGSYGRWTLGGANEMLEGGVMIFSFHEMGGMDSDPSIWIPEADLPETLATQSGLKLGDVLAHPALEALRDVRIKAIRTREGRSMIEIDLEPGWTEETVRLASRPAARRCTD